MSRPTILPRAEGKHTGHAVEGHCRGLFARLLRPRGFEVRRSLPFLFPVKPDLVILDADLRILLLGIVAYARDAKGTDKKFYRTRLEHLEILRCWRLHADAFHPDFSPLVILYGSETGWKPELLRDLKAQCPPTFVLPEIVGAETCRQIVTDAYEVYCRHWGEGRNDAREQVEEHFAGLDVLPADHEAMACLLLDRFARRPGVRHARRLAERIAGLVVPARVPEPGNWRIRQGLSLASLFAPEEVAAWLAPGNRTLGRSAQLDAFARRGMFLDVVSLREDARIRSLTPPRERPLVAEPRRALRTVGRRQEYAPDRPDFAGWDCLGAERVADYLDRHRRLPRFYPKTFPAGALDQVMGNWCGYCRAWHGHLGGIAAALRSRSLKPLVDALTGDSPVGAEPWQPTAGTAHVAPGWDACVAAEAVCRGDRATFQRWDFRRTDLPTQVDARRLARVLLDGNPDLAANLLSELDDYAGLLLNGSFADLFAARRARLLSLDEPCSWVSAWYLRVVTNPSHTPLGHAVRDWLTHRFPEAQWLGWPEKRSAPLRICFSKHAGRVQWQFIGREPSGRVVVAEVKSVTANNWGNKSKELYDRIAETRRAAVDARAHGLLIIGVLDGDLEEPAIKEIASGMAYDETCSIGEVLGLQAALAI
jgi:hypothetical protein